MKKLVVLSGVPGSGKSYFSDALRKARGSHTYIVSSDRLRYEITGNQQNLTEDKLMWKLFYEYLRVYAIDENALTVMDCTNLFSIHRINAIEDLRKMYDEIILVAFNLDKDTVRYQNMNRLYPIDEKTWEEMYDSYTGIGEEDAKFFDKIYTIKNHDIKPIIDELL